MTYLFADSLQASSATNPGNYENNIPDNEIWIYFGLNDGNLTGPFVPGTGTLKTKVDGDWKSSPQGPVNGTNINAGAVFI